MEALETIGSAVHERWARFGFDECRLPEIATAVLEEHRPHARCGQRELLAWLAETGNLPVQTPLGFGQPPVTLYRDDQLLVEALFWLDGTTSLHQHGFSGAFCVLEGSSVHAIHTFERDARIGDHLVLGQLSAREVELLGPGQVRPIVAGDSFIHALFHLERPTLSLVVRSHRAWMEGPQYAYYPPGLGINPFYHPESLARRLDVLMMLLDAGHPQLEAFTRSFARRADPFALTQVMLAVNRHKSGYGLVDGLLQQTRGAHPGLADMLERVLPRDRDRSLLVARRQALSAPELRFLLGIVLNATGRERIVSLVAARYPSRNPIEVLLGWIEQLVQTRDSTGNALGVELDADGFWILRRLLEGSNERAIMAESATLGRPIGALQLAKTCLTLQYNSVLGPLLGENT